MLCCVGLFGGLYVGQSLGGHWTITAPAMGFGLGLIGDMKFMRGMHGQNSPNSNNKNKMSSGDSSPEREKTENPLLQGSDINTKEVRRDSG
ncbi:MAG: hypothetical protein GTO02_14680 [Candidatus Dadabacteria bacterium]|nr:hypothetical protein [Candidatus Dadabacteria bacterium]NIQ15588.1 hypothetical protein [Candidatus Dadabacteria bacterium]